MNLCVVEDNTFLLENLRALLSGEPDIFLTACYTSAEEALDGQQNWTDLDILLVDLDLPGLSGIDLIQRVRPLSLNLNILVYTVYEDRTNVIEAIRAGACGYLIKGSSSRDLVEALREIHAGGAPISPRIARYVLSHLQQSEPPDASQKAQELTQREVVILRLLENGHSYKELAVQLGVSSHTVHAHIKNIYQKLQASGRSEAIRIGRVRGLL
jgi:two-component system NarL family response regulator